MPLFEQRLPLFERPSADLRHGDCLDVLPTLTADSIDAIVTDPPAGIAFMGKEWDRDKGGRDKWIGWMTEVAAECLRVLKPGGHALVWSLPRTSHWTATAWEDAGFAPRDRIAHIFGSGFPKSLDVSKAIDKANGEVGRLHRFTAWMRTTGLTAGEVDAATGTNMGGHYLTDKSQPAIPTPELWVKLRPLCGDVPGWVDALVERIAAEREVLGKHPAPATSIYGDTEVRAVNLTAPATEAARRWGGWGTALKPAIEDWWLFRKPLSEKTVAENVQRWGTGAINVDGCRVAHGEECRMMAPQANIDIPSEKHRQAGRREAMLELKPSGRWPANLIHDGSEEVLAGFPETGGAHGGKGEFKQHTWAGSGRATAQSIERDSGGSAARFFYCAKASKADRGEGNTHPTVKPHELMRYLCRLVTPPGGIVLDPFMGSGSTGKAALREGFRFLGIEQGDESIRIAQKRIGG